MRVLVTAASKHRATEAIATAIAAGLAEEGIRVEVRRPETVDSIVDYDAVVLGSAVYTGRWLPAARAFVDRHRADLERRPVWLFSSGPLGDPAMEIPEAEDALRLVADLRARGHRTFAGRLEREELNLAERAIIRIVRAPSGDVRPWPEIADWAREIASALRPGIPVGAR
jgi:menaquinone-dependent protoporphyrinogen oxidase